MKELFELILVILLPPLLIILVIIVFAGKGQNIRKRFTSTFKLNPYKGLDQQGLLWLSIVIPVAYFFAFGIYSWSGNEISLNKTGFKNFLAISELPLWLLSLSIPFSILVARVHATKQTSLQIKITEYKNNIDSYHSHRKELFEYFKKIGEVDYLGCIKAKYEVHPRLHKNYFMGKPEDGFPEINKAAFEDIEDEFRSAAWELDSVIRNVNPESTYDIYIANLSSTIYRIGQSLGIKEIYNDLSGRSVLVPVELEQEGKKELLTIGQTTNDAIAAFRYAYNFYCTLCDFSGCKITNLGNEYEYLLSGKKYRELVIPLVIEKIHEKLVTRSNRNS